tara:strand:- start:495 stop:1193 length:699 start_codon:yes stop_codon:yes gene_type:complete
MNKYFLLFLFIGFIYGNKNNDLLVYKNGLRYSGEFSRVEKNTVYFKPQGFPAFQQVYTYQLDRVELNSGKILNFKEIVIPDSMARKNKARISTILFLQKGEKKIMFNAGHRIIVNNYLSGTIKGITSDHLIIDTGDSNEEEILISSITQVFLPADNKSLKSFRRGARIGAGCIIVPIVFLSIGSSEAHYGIVFAGIAAPIAAVLGGATAAVFSKKKPIEDFMIKDSAWTISK